ncbi:hypothetical protein ABKN59_007101 [Abortiporus biennis]
MINGLIYTVFGFNRSFDCWPLTKTTTKNNCHFIDNPTTVGPFGKSRHNKGFQKVAVASSFPQSLFREPRRFYSLTPNTNTTLCGGRSENINRFEPPICHSCSNNVPQRSFIKLPTDCISPRSGSLPGDSRRTLTTDVANIVSSL